MSNKYLLSIDPGLSTGVTLLSYTDETAPELEKAWQFRGGAEALNEWMDEEWYGYGASYGLENVISLAEKFNPRGSGQGFAYTASSLEPLRCEGVLVAHGLPDQYVQPPQQYLVGGKDKAEKRRRQHKFLKESGFYRTGKDLDAPDADDFRSACAHALSFLMRTGHKPTYDLVTNWIERDPV